MLNLCCSGKLCLPDTEKLRCAHCPPEVRERFFLALPALQSRLPSPKSPCWQRPNLSLLRLPPTPVANHQSRQSRLRPCRLRLLIPSGTAPFRRKKSPADTLSLRAIRRALSHRRDKLRPVAIRWPGPPVHAPS